MASVGLFPAIPLIVGAALSLGSSAEAASLVWVLLCLTAGAVAAWLLRLDGVCSVTLAAAFAVAGCALGADARDRALDPTLRTVLDREIGGASIESLGPLGDHDPLTLRARLTEDAGAFDDFASLRLRALALRLSGEWHEVQGGVTLSVSGTAFVDLVREWRAGRIVEAPVTFRRPARYLNDGVTDFERDLALGGTTLFGSVKSGLLVEVIARGTVVGEWAADVRAHVRSAVRTWVSRRATLSGAIVTAVLIGDRTGLPDQVRERLQAAGTYHVIAISGGNIAILAGIGLGALMVSGIRGRAAALLTVAGLLAYAQVATTGPSVWRATLMAVIYLTARALDHRTPPWHATAFAAALMVVVRPLDVRDAGFVLTFGATAALLEGARRGMALMRGRGIVSWVVGSLIASVAVELALLPVSAQAFSRVTVAGLVLNLVAVPLMGVAQVAGMAVAALSPFATPASMAGWFAHAGSQALVRSAGLVDVAPWLSMRVPPPGAGLLAAYYIALALLLLGRRRHARACGGAALAVALTAIATGIGPSLRFQFEASSPRPVLRMTVFDVGQAESLLLETPEGPTVLVDAGGSPFGDDFDIGGRVLAPALWARGLRAIDAMLITHGDPDHLGGAPALIEILRPSTLWEGVVVPAHAPMAAVREAVVGHRGRVSTVRSGRDLAWGAARARVLHPPEPDWERPRVRNDDSVVIEVVYGEVAMLLTGDISEEVERAILPRLSRAAMRVLKVAHHGSRTSSSTVLLEAWRPQLALISAGRGNSFGHPAADVIRRLQSIGATVLRTDLHGQITVETDGRTLRSTTFTGGRK